MVWAFLTTFKENEKGGGEGGGIGDEGRGRGGKSEKGGLTKK